MEKEVTEFPYSIELGQSSKGEAYIKSVKVKGDSILRVDDRLMASVRVAKKGLKELMTK